MRAAKTAASRPARSPQVIPLKRTDLPGRVIARRYRMARPLENLFTTVDRASLAHAARTAFHMHGYTLEEIGEVMKVIDATRDGRAEEAGRDIPVGDAVVELEEGAVEREDGGGRGEVDGVSIHRMRLDETVELRQRGGEAREVVGRAVDVARVEFAGGVVFDLGRFRVQRRGG